MFATLGIGCLGYVVSGWPALFAPAFIIVLMVGFLLSLGGRGTG